MTVSSRLLTWCLAILLALTFPVGALGAGKYSPEYEARIGREAIEQIQKEYKVYEDPEQLQRVQTIVDALKSVSQRPDVDYQIYLLDTEEENAFSIPGGYICVTKQLLTNIQSEHQLAGVIAHEMAHNCTYDALEEAAKAQKMTTPVLAAVIAAIVTGRSSEAISTTLAAGLYVMHSVLSTFSQEVEARADANAVDYLVKSGKYDPTGLLTFMEYLAVRERTTPQIELGIFKTHPFSTSRVKAISDQIRAAGLDINRRAVTRWDPPALLPSHVGDHEAQTLTLWQQPLFTFNYAPPGTDVAARGADMVAALTEVLALGAQLRDFEIGEQSGNPVLFGWGRPVLVIYPEDAALHQTSPHELAGQVLSGLKAALYNESLARMFGSGPAVALPPEPVPETPSEPAPEPSTEPAPEATTDPA